MDDAVWQIRRALYPGLSEPLSDDEVTETLTQLRNPNARDHTLSTILELCIDVKTVPISDRRYQIAQYLLTHGADPNLLSRDNWTSVHWCAKYGDLELLKMIVKKGGKVNLVTKQDETAVSIASKYKHDDVMVYCDRQSCNLKQMCRAAIVAHMGCRRARVTAWKLPLPVSLRLFMNYGNMYPGYQLIPVPPLPWSNEELKEKKVEKHSIIEFMLKNADEEFLSEKKLSISSAPDGHEYQHLVDALECLYLYESFKPINYTEPLARESRIDGNWARLKTEVDILYGYGHDI